MLNRDMPRYVVVLPHAAPIHDGQRVQQTRPDPEIVHLDTAYLLAFRPRRDLPLHSEKAMTPRGKHPAQREYKKPCFSQRYPHHKSNSTIVLIRGTPKIV